MSRTFDCSAEDDRETALTAAASAVAAQELVVFPTDTVYGVGADAFAPGAVARLLAAKGRGRDVPVPVLVGSWRTVNGLVDTLPAVASDLIAAFWPGPLTLVLPAATGLSWDLGETHGTVAVRMPLQPIALELLQKTGPLATSSANRHGNLPATTVAEATSALGDDIAVYLDGGPCVASAPSTVLDLTSVSPRVLRSGPVTPEAIRDLLGVEVG